MSDANIRILQRYLPETAIEPFLDYWRENHLALHISKERNSKLGDYRLPSPDHPQHAISVNGNLCRELFLWVLLHEMAHLDTFVAYGRRVQPHGHEWQQAYARLMNKYVHCFPTEVQPLILQCSSTIPLRRAWMKEVELRLAACDPTAQLITILNSQPSGTLFSLRDKPCLRFRAIERRRTRWICVNIDNGRRYLISGSAAIEIIPS